MLSVIICVTVLYDKLMPGPKRSRCLLSDEQEENLVTWIRENELLYKKSLKAFKDTAKKEQLWRNKAEELNVTGNRICFSNIN